MRDLLFIQCGTVGLNELRNNKYNMYIGSRATRPRATVLSGHKIQAYFHSICLFSFAEPGIAMAVASRFVILSVFVAVIIGHLV